MPQYEFYLTDSLQKVFGDGAPPAMAPDARLSALRGEVPAVQLVCRKQGGGARGMPQPFVITVSGAPVPARLRRVRLMPSDMPAYELADDGYLTTAPGLFPDMLEPAKDGSLTPTAHGTCAMWIDFPGLGAAEPGVYTVAVQAAAVAAVDVPNGTACRFDEAPVFECRFTLEVLPAALPEQTLLHTEWMHTDCLADYYGFEVFSEEYWRAAENHIAAAADYTVNMLYTPVFTPPLDTAVGAERTTVQLVDIALDEKGYAFGFEKLERWCGLAKKYGITHIEVAHLFTQWGAKATPKIMVKENGTLRRKFGWDVPADSPEYRRFLQAFIPALRQALAGFGYDTAHVVFHISDEPEQRQLEDYRKARAQVIDLVEGHVVMDALSSFAFYEKGVVACPVPANDHIQPFLDAGVPDLWTYYCCGQCYKVPNRFYAQPSARNRIMGVLMYVHRIKGFLQWGFNFYGGQFSLRKGIDPYYDTSCGRSMPSGDPYLVYPGENLEAIGSIRGEVLRQATHDMMALQLLESLAGREFVLGLVMEGVSEKMTFEDYPRGAEYLLNLREKVNREIKARA